MCVCVCMFEFFLTNCYFHKSNLWVLTCIWLELDLKLEGSTEETSRYQETNNYPAVAWKDPVFLYLSCEHKPALTKHPTAPLKTSICEWIHRISQAGLWTAGHGAARCRIKPVPQPLWPLTSPTGLWTDGRWGKPIHPLSSAPGPLTLHTLTYEALQRLFSLIDFAQLQIRFIVNNQQWKLFWLNKIKMGFSAANANSNV